MTREEREDAIIFFKEVAEREVNNAKYSKLAIEALEQEPKTGHWVEEKINVGCRRVFCSECGSAPPFEYVSDGDVYSASGYGVINKTKYCPNCGARMVEPQESEDKE